MEVKLKIIQTISSTKQSRQQNTSFLIGSNFDPQCQLSPSYIDHTPTLHQYPLLYQRPQTYPNF